jgi:hypothetical protein
VLPLDGQQDPGPLVRWAMWGGGGRNGAHGTPVEGGAGGTRHKRLLPGVSKNFKGPA